MAKKTVVVYLAEPSHRIVEKFKCSEENWRRIKRFLELEKKKLPQQRRKRLTKQGEVM